MIAELRDILAALAAEREAIKKLDGAGVERAALAKEQFAKAVVTIDVAAHRADLAIVASELRRNGVLLAHARSCLREVVNLAKSQTRVQARL